MSLSDIVGMVFVALMPAIPLFVLLLFYLKERKSK